MKQVSKCHCRSDLPVLVDHVNATLVDWSGVRVPCKFHLLGESSARLFGRSLGRVFSLI